VNLNMNTIWESIKSNFIITSFAFLFQNFILMHGMYSKNYLHDRM